MRLGQLKQGKKVTLPDGSPQAQGLQREAASRDAQVEGERLEPQE